MKTKPHLLFQHNQRAHRPGELGAGAAEQRPRRGAVRRAGQVDGAAVVPAPGARQQDGVVAAVHTHTTVDIYILSARSQ